MAGAGGHARVSAEVARLTLDIDVDFFADVPSNNPCSPISGSMDVLLQELPTYAFGFVGIGLNSARESISERLRDSGLVLVTLVHESATVSPTSQIGSGTLVTAGAVISTGAWIGDGVIVNTRASIDHDCRVGHYSHISPGATLAGTVTVGERSWIGAGATVINGVTIGHDAIVGAGAVVVKDVPPGATVVGIPAKARV